MEKATARWADEIATDERFAGLLYESGLRSWMAAHLVVTTVDLDADERAYLRIPNLRDGGDGPFLSLPFTEAIEAFRAREILTPEEFDEIRDRFREGGFTAARLASERLRARAKAAIQRALEGGSTIADTIADIQADELLLGYTPSSHDYLDTVVRTNVASTYGAGRYRAMRQPEVIRLRPYWQYLSAGDSKVRPAHAALHGRVWEAEDEAASHYFTPLGYRCRCTMISRSRREIERNGYEITTGRIDGVEPDAGWERLPLAA